MRARWTAFAGGVVLFLASALGLLLSTGPVAAVGETVVATPSSGLTDGATVSVDVTTTSATDATVFIAVTQCGNADSSGTPLSSVSEGDCVGAEGFGTGLQLIGFPTGAVTAGTHNVSLTAKQTGIGANGAQCIAMPPATLPCVIQASTATTAGAYTGPGYNFAASASITYSAAVTTTTSSPTTTTLPPATSTTTTSTTTVGPTTTTSAVTPTTATPSTGAVIVGALPAPTTTTTVPAVKLAGQTLAFTGPTARTWWTLGLGLALLDLGYVALSITRTNRRRLFGRSRS